MGTGSSPTCVQCNKVALQRSLPHIPHLCSMHMQTSSAPPLSAPQAAPCPAEFANITGQPVAPFRPSPWRQQAQ